ncbi:MAG: lipid A deacylase LpxR family protein, partial [Rhodospirillales bacterium]
MRRTALSIIAALSAVALAGNVAAQPAPESNNPFRLDGSTLTLQIENDFFTGPTNNKDRHYSSGLRLNWLSPPIGGTPQWLRDFTDSSETALGFLDSRQAGPVRRRLGISVGQSIYTPQDKDAVVPLPNDRPYAAWLYLGVSLQTIRYDGSKGAPDPIRQDIWELDVGMIGPAALGEQTQNGFHALIGSPKSRGWDHQLHNELGVNLTYERRWRLGRLKLIDAPIKLRFDMVPTVGFSVGNVNTYAAAGGIFRLGENLGNDFGPPRIRPSLPGSESIDPESGFGWYVFAGANGEAVLRNITLDGNRHSPNVDKKLFVGDLTAGLAIFIGGSRLSYTYVVRSKEFDGQKGVDQYGAITFT